MITLYRVDIMKKGFKIKEVAKDRGMTLTGIAKKLGMPRSNMSAIASGARGVSLKVLHKISRILDCSMDELMLSEKHSPIFKDKKTQSLLRIVESQNYDGIDKSWVDRIMLAQKMHYGAVKRTRQ